MSRFGKGALLMILSALGFSAMQIAIAKTAQGIPLFEQLFFRNLFACIAAFVSLRRKNLAAFGKRENRGLLVFRSAAGYAGMIALFYASGHAAQGDVAIINKMSPFVVTVLACLFLKEKFTAYQGVALGLAFGGALLVSNPTFQSHWFPVAVAFLSAVFSGVAYTAIGALKNREPPEVIVFFFSLFSTIASGIAMLPQFKVPDARELAWLICIGVFAFVGQIALTQAYVHAPAAQVSIFNYSGILFSMILGNLFLGQVPALSSAAGGVLVFLAGIVILIGQRNAGNRTFSSPFCGGRASRRRCAYDQGPRSGPCSRRRTGKESPPWAAADPAP